MKLKDAVKRAVEGRDAAAAGAIADFLRCKGFDYAGILSLVQRICPGTDPRDWEALLYESETM